MDSRRNSDDAVPKGNDCEPVQSHSRTGTLADPGKSRMNKPSSPPKKEIENGINKSSAKDVAELKDYVCQTVVSQ